MQDNLTENWYWYKRMPEGTVCIFRMFGTSPQVLVPETILGKRVTELGSYCFSETEKAESFEICSDSLAGSEAEKRFQILFSKKAIRCLSGEYLEKVFLPQSITEIGNCCFYRCNRLQELTIGNGLTAVGSDDFMNCRKLQNITVLGSVTEPSGLKQVLGQRSLETRVEFVVNGLTEAVLIYPEYSETYDEIGPAHIFELNIAGEGFRARQCFSQGIVDLAQYDAVFLQAQAEESVKTLCYMAGMRLSYPIGLREENKRKYEEYLKKYAMRIVEILVKERDLKLLPFCLEQEYFEKEEVQKGAQLAASMDWTEGAALFLRTQKKWSEKGKREQYSFDDF